MGKARWTTTFRLSEFASKPMNELLRLNIKNAFEAIPPANEAITQWLDARSIPPSTAYVANLAIEELVTNCIKYGYDDQAEHDIELNLSASDRQLTLTIIDDGHPFNPLKAPEPNTDLPIEARPVGGLGIHLLRKLADGMTYERSDGRNRVTIIKQIPH